MSEREHRSARESRLRVEILTDHIEDGRRVVLARGPLAQWSMEVGDDDPAFPSRPLARSLGMARERNLHHIIRGLYPTEMEITPTTSAKYDTDEKTVHFRMLSHAQGAGRPIKEYLLSRRQVLKVIMRSNSARASDLQDELIEVLLTVLRHVEYVRARVTEEDINRIVDERVARLLTAHGSSLIAREEADSIKARLRVIARWWSLASPLENYQSIRRRGERRLRRMGKLAEDVPWTYLRRQYLDDVLEELYRMEREAHDAAKKAATLRQGDLF